MKKLKYLLLVLVSSTFMLSVANAEVKTESLKEACKTERLTCNYTEKDTSKLPNIYVFRGNGCGYCKNLLSHLSSIYNEISDKVNIVVYEVSDNADNWAFYQKVAKKFGDTVSGYPYMVIGKVVFNGYASDFDNDISKAIEKLATSEDAYDVVSELKRGNTEVVEKDTLKEEKEPAEESKSSIVIAFIFGVVIVVGIFTGYQVSKK